MIRALEHKCETEGDQDIRIIYHDGMGWYLWFNYPNETNCEIVYCPFCGIKLDDLDV